MKKSFLTAKNIFGLSFFGLLIGFTTMSFSMPDQTISLSLETLDNCPTASFTISNNGCLGPCEIIFNNQSQGATSSHWDFGDGNTSTELNPSHTYQAAGSYSVTLTAIVDGCAIPFIGTIDVLEG